MDLPAYIKNPESNAVTEENYHEEFNQTIRQNIGPNGFAITNITNTDLNITPVIDPITGEFTTVKNLMPIGTIWFVLDTSVWVGKTSDSPVTLVQFTTTPYP